MVIKLVVFRLLVLAVLFAALSPICGTAVRADLEPVAAGRELMRTARMELGERFIRKVDFPHDSGEACHWMLMCVR